MIPLFRSFLLFLSLPLQRILDLQHLQSDKVYAFKGLTADTQMCWCANSAICLTIRTANAELDEQDEVILLTLEGAIWRFLFCVFFLFFYYYCSYISSYLFRFLRKPYDECVQLVPEIDGTRIYTKSNTVFLSPLHRLRFIFFSKHRTSFVYFTPSASSFSSHSTHSSHFPSLSSSQHPSTKYSKSAPPPQAPSSSKPTSASLAATLAPTSTSSSSALAWARPFARSSAPLGCCSNPRSRSTS